MTGQLKRQSPQRAFTQGENNLKRIVLSAAKNRESQIVPKPIRMPENPKFWLLVAAHSEKGMLDDHAHQTIAAAAILAADDTAVAVVVMGDLFENLSEVGADEVIVRPELDFTHFQPEAELACLKAAIAHYQPTHILLPDNAIGDGDLGRRLIAATGKTGVIQTTAFDTKAALPDIVLLAPHLVDSHLPFVGHAKHENLAFKTSKPLNYEDLGLSATEASQTALEEADCVVSAGNGVANIETLKTLATLLGASIGASRVAVDDGKFAREQQVGATGKTVSASTYFAIGISGAVQHLQGIKDCRHVIAINTDASAPMIKRADLSIIGDAEEVMQALILAIKEAQTMQEAQAIQETQIMQELKP